MTADLKSPAQLKTLFDRLAGKRDEIAGRRAQQSAARNDVIEYLSVAKDVSDWLEKITEQLFSQLVGELQSQLTRALQDVLNQPIELKVTRDFKAGAVTLEFYVERAGQRENIMRGQGGSVQNVLSVGLRILALAAVEPSQHRRFLILDEQDCWLRPELVPALVRIVHEAGRRLGFQTLMISHHDANLFRQYADRTYRCTPANDPNGSAVVVERVE